ncbi:MAG: hypothetical protein IJD85_05685 [Oscillospiraceae bacterium]|nr:hypothetical protein [Oscillospiraceae bacterium]
MKILITYISKTGFTKEYTDVIAQNIVCDVIEFKHMSSTKMSEYDVVVFGSRAHAGMVDSLKKARTMFAESTAKKLVVFCTGAAPCEAEDIINEFWTNNLSAEELEQVPHFYMQSGLRYESMNFADKTMMKIAAFMMSRQKESEKNDVDKGFEQAISHSYDISDEKYALPLIEYLKSM